MISEQYIRSRPFYNDKEHITRVHRSNAFLPSKIENSYMEERLKNLYVDVQNRPAKRELDYTKSEFSEQTVTILHNIGGLYFQDLFPDEIFSVEHPLIKALQDFERQFLFKGGESKFSTYRNLPIGGMYFSNIKDNLEKIFFLSSNLNESRNLPESRRAIKDLIQYLGNCAPGLTADLDDLVLHLSNNNNINFWMSKLRTDIADTYASIAIGDGSIPMIYEAHVHTKLIVLSHELGYQPLKSNIYDYYLSRITISQQGISNFKKYFFNEYSVDNILNVISDNLNAMINKLHEKHPPVQDGWMECATNYNEIVTMMNEIVSSLNVNAVFEYTVDTEYPSKAPTLDSLFVFSDDSCKVRIRPEISESTSLYLEKTLIEQGVFTTRPEYSFWGMVPVRATIGKLPEPSDVDMSNMTKEQQRKITKLRETKAAVSDEDISEILASVGCGYTPQINVYQQIENGRHATERHREKDLRYRIERQKQKRKAKKEEKRLLELELKAKTEIFRNNYNRDILITCAAICFPGVAYAYFMVGAGLIFSLIVVPTFILLVVGFVWSNEERDKDLRVVEQRFKPYISNGAREAFQDGVNSKLSWGNYFTTFFHLNSHRHLAAFQAGEKAVEKEDLRLYVRFQ